MTIRRFFQTACIASLLTILDPAAVHAAGNMIPNGNFEDGKAFWSMWVPDEHEGTGCEFLISDDAPHSGTACAEMKSLARARYSIGSRKYEGGPVMPGKRYRLTYWIRMDQNLKAKGGPAFLVRFMLQDAGNQPVAGARALLIGLDGKYTIQALQGKLKLDDLSTERPTEWTKVESVFELPEDSGADHLDKPTFFAMFTEGSLFLDDISLEEVDAKVPLSPSF